MPTREGISSTGGSLAAGTLLFVTDPARIA